MAQLRPSFAKHQNTGDVMTVWPSTMPYSWPTFKFYLRNPLPLIKSGALFLMTQCSAMSVRTWKMKPGVTLTERIWAQARSLSPESRTDRLDAGSQMEKRKVSHHIPKLSVDMLFLLRLCSIEKEGFSLLGKRILESLVPPEGIWPLLQIAVLHIMNRVSQSTCHHPHALTASQGRQTQVSY